jgi:hypothetical protein
MTRWSESDYEHYLQERQKLRWKMAKKNKPKTEPLKTKMVTITNPKFPGLRRDGGLNKTEQRFAEDHPIAISMPGSLKIAKKCFYHPDFIIPPRDGELPLYVDVKGYKGGWKDDALVKIKACEAKFGQCFRFAFAWPKKGTRGGWEWRFFP